VPKKPARLTGDYVVTSGFGESVRAFVPRPLPPVPALDLQRLSNALAKADQALGRLDGITTILPSTDLFVFMYVRKEALLSSQIEGTQSSLSDLLLFEDAEPTSASMDDVVEVSNYIAAMNHGLARLKDGFPLSLRLIREMHAELLSRGRGSGKQPGDFRRSQNWIGGTRPGNAAFVPPPPNKVPECLNSLELFLHDRATYPVLIRAALAHLQFETIHPFLDGNGRLGRLLITLLLCEEMVLSQPVLYLSLFLKAHRARYYELLQDVRERGNWEDWIEFLLEGVTITATQGVTTAQRLLAVFKEDEAKIAGIGRAAPQALRVFVEMQRRPLISVAVVAKALGLSHLGLQKSIDRLVDLGILFEISGKRRNRIYEYSRYLRILDEGTEPL
jgi:Fic family protein